MANTLVTREELAARINMGVFRVENGNVFTSSNTDKFCDVATPKLKEDADIPTVLKNCQVPTWSSPGFASLPFILAAPRWEGPLFGRLAQNQEVFPIIRGVRGWHLPLPLQESWQRLEVALYDAIQTLNTAVITFPCPFRFGYLKSHPTKGKARYHALQSRNAFLPLMATLSDAIAAYIPNPRSLHFETVRNEYEESGPHWVNMLLKRGVNRAWVTLLEQSQVATFSRETKRVGVFINPSDCPTHERRIDRLLLAHVPIWTWMGNGLPSFFPDKPACEIDVVKRFQLTENQLAAATTWPPPSIPSTSVPTYPKPEAGSGQRSGETWPEFFARRAAKNEQTKLHETAVQRQSREDKEKNAEAHTMPSSRSRTRVFMWDDSDPSFLVRRAVYHAEVETWWNEFSVHQRRYDGFRDEWDLCSEFGPGSPSQSPRLYDDDDIVFTATDHIFTSQPETTAPGSPTHHDQNLHDAPPAAASHADMAMVYHEGISNIIIDVDQLDNILHYRYGVHDSAYESTKAFDVKKWDVIRRDLSHSEDLSVNDTRYKLKVIDFVERVLDATRTISGELCDLHPSHSAYLTKYKNSNIEVTPHVFGTETWYKITAKLDTVTKWQLFVEDPTTAAQCYRHWYETLPIIAHDFLRVGVPFSTRMSGPPGYTQPLPSIQHPNPLGYQLQGYQPNLIDYAAYEAARNTFLTHPRARAALLKGGIIWRLSIEFLQNEPLVWGPSGDLNHSHAWSTEDDGTLWDDDLSDDELDLISGVYRVFTGSGLQTSASSWWPRHSAWKKGGLNVGYWSPDCERWFQKRLEMIRDGKATLRSAHDWKSALIKNKRTPRFVKAYNEESQKYLTGLLV